MMLRFVLPLVIVIIGIASLVQGLHVVGGACVTVAVVLFLVAALMPDAP